MTPNIVVHVGFSKTGTTTLQKHLFAGHSQIEYLGKPHNDFLQTEISRLVKQETTVYDSSSLKRYIQSEAREKPTGPGKRVTLLSNEILLSRGKARDRGVVAERVKEVFYPCKIMITIRNQFDILKSAYLSSDRMLSYVPRKYEGLGVDFRQWLELSYRYYEELERGYFYQADYFKIIHHYTKLFGKEHVGVFLLEEFILHPEEYVKKLVRFLDIDGTEALTLVGGKHEHKEIPQAQLDFELLKAKLFPFSRFAGFSFLLNGYYKFSKLFRKEKISSVSIPAEWLERLKGIYSEGNRQLIEEYGLPLEVHGYPL